MLDAWYSAEGAGWQRVGSRSPLSFSEPGTKDISTKSWQWLNSVLPTCLSDAIQEAASLVCSSFYFFFFFPRSNGMASAALHGPNSVLSSRSWYLTAHWTSLLIIHWRLKQGCPKFNSSLYTSLPCSICSSVKGLAIHPTTQMQNLGVRPNCSFPHLLHFHLVSKPTCVWPLHISYAQPLLHPTSWPLPSSQLSSFTVLL